ncbi:MAG: cytochrome c family protein [Methylocystis sp.]|jgi:cytochrome c|nr:cytochrome c family protein [Methylocystis sp.]MCA3583002.1 cytochrome c family protein [Methylocystis sp.]MCA3587325.1 cytochrome c family protein [Methylocystis sp.]MCA3590407.1 cytochrome c family protein [Methylocystis sp.]
MRSVQTLAASALVFAAMAAVPAAAQDIAAGEKIFLQCRTCHQIGENAKNAVGPQLNGLFANRKAGTAEGYSYSNAYKTLDKVWTVENFTTYIKDPRGVTPGTKMVYAGLKDETQIANLIAFLSQFGPDGKKK